MQFPKELSPQVLPMPRQSERGTARGTEAGFCFALLGRLGAKKCHECDKCQARKLSSWLSPSMPCCADQITLTPLRTRRFEHGNVASLEAAKWAFRAAWDRRPGA